MILLLFVLSGAAVRYDEDDDDDFYFQGPGDETTLEAGAEKNETEPPKTESRFGEVNE